MVRLLLVVILTTLAFSGWRSGVIPKVSLSALSLLCMSEVFFHYKVNKKAPRKSVTDETSVGFEHCTREVIDHLYGSETIENVIPKLLHFYSLDFMLRKATIERRTLPLVSVPTEDVLKRAALLVKATKGTLITTMDILGAYMLIIEPQTKTLFNAQIKEEEWLDILAWARKMFKEEEFPPKVRVQTSGSGIGEVLTTGWTLETKKYTSDFSYKAYRMLPQIVGREGEFKQLLDGLSKPDNNNVLLIGDSGSGKENLVAYLVQQSFTNEIPHGLNHIKVLELLIGPLIAGAANRAELETRLQAIIEEVSHSGNVILYIPEFQNIIGSSSYEVDLSGALLPYLKEGKMPVIATVSVGNFKTYLEKNAVREAFTSITLSEPDKRTAMAMVLYKSQMLEQKYTVALSFKAIETAVQYANRYFQDAALPGSAVQLLEDAAHKLQRVSQKQHTVLRSDDVIALIEEKTHIALATPQGAEKELLLHLEERLHERVIGQGDAIKAISEALRRLRSGLVVQERPMSFLFLGPTGVGKTETARALADLYFGGEKHIIRLDMSEYADEEGVKRLLGAPPGEGNERGELTDKVADNPFSLVLLDEFEKAYPKILDLFLQVLEDGRLTDNKGKTVSFVNTLIIATSNAGAEYIREEVSKGTSIDKTFSHKLLDHLQSTHLFRPELLNRFDDVIIFQSLGQEQMTHITRLMLEHIVKSLEEQDITLTFDQSVIDKAIKEGFDPEFGARPLRRYIQDTIEDVLARKKLEGALVRGSTIFVTVDANGTIIVKNT